MPCTLLHKILSRFNPPKIPFKLSRNSIEKPFGRGEPRCGISILFHLDISIGSRDTAVRIWGGTRKGWWMTAEIPGNAVTHFFPAPEMRTPWVTLVKKKKGKKRKKKNVDSASVTDQRTWDRSVNGRATRTATARTKVAFKRRYLENGTSHRFRIKTVLKKTIPRFQRAGKSTLLSGESVVAFGRRLRCFNWILLKLSFVDSRNISTSIRFDDWTTGHCLWIKDYRKIWNLVSSDGLWRLSSDSILNCS